MIKPLELHLLEPKCAFTDEWLTLQFSSTDVREIVFEGSSIFERRFHSSASKCQVPCPSPQCAATHPAKGENDPSACQALANLCALTLYRTESPSCRAFAAIQSRIGIQVSGFPGWYRGLPFLFYEGDPNIIASRTAITRQVALQGQVRPYQLACPHVAELIPQHHRLRIFFKRNLARVPPVCERACSHCFI